MKVPTDPSLKHRILVADDHPLLRDGVVQLINRQDDLICCGEADSAQTTKSSAAAMLPDLVLLDLRMGGGDGFELIRSLKALLANMPILILSQYDEALYVQRALRAGANGYVTKDQATDEVLDAIRTVLRGGTYLSSNIASRVLQKIIEMAAGTDKTGGVESLTDRELHIFLLIGGGKVTKEMAAELNLSPSTVETHRERIKQKLGLPSSQEVAQFAQDWLSKRDAPSPGGQGNKTP